MAHYSSALCSSGSVGLLWCALDVEARPATALALRQTQRGET
ncbi:MAG TPA: hypothetical protein VGS41_03695 [Chthonomonadales bacterium]|nr:hypothetical protein [Chthonomonadales bacterium]